VQINILIPMAGRGRRFREVGYLDPKPMISIAGRPMIDWSLQSLAGLTSPHRFIFIALKDDLDSGLRGILESRGEIVSIPNVTEGAVNTTLLASHLIEDESPLIIANCDQYLDWDFNKFLASTDGFDCSVVVFESDNPHHSYVETQGKRVVRVKEKEVISPLACGGIYFYRKGHDYLAGAKRLIEDEDRTNGEFYITPIFNKLIEEGRTVTYFKIENHNKHMLGTPEEVDVFLQKLDEREKST